MPFREFVVKVHSRCNLACDYCYVYESADQSWVGQPRRMAESTVARTADRVAEHVATHGLTAVDVVLHGGEPLLAGADFIVAAARTFRAAADCEVRVSLQTNGVLLTERVLGLLSAHGIGVSVSLDGDRTAHDRHRTYGDGRGSHTAVAAGLSRLMSGHRGIYQGLLCTIDLANDPVATYEALLEFDPPGMDFLLPHGTWSAPPPGRRPYDDGTTPYADWLIAAFDRWYGAPTAETGIRYFDEVMNVVLGGQSRSESVGLSPVAMIVVETDGTLQQVDSLKVAFDHAPETGLNVFDHPFDLALKHPGVIARQIGADALAAECRACPVMAECGGGAYAHRFREPSGYRNPSVYCPDLLKLNTHIKRTVERDLVPIGR